MNSRWHIVDKLNGADFGYWNGPSALSAYKAMMRAAGVLELANHDHMATFAITLEE